MERATANRTMAKAISMPSTTLKELKNWVSEDSDWDTMTRRKLLEKTLWGGESIAMMG
jgi:hypothetical protein